MSLGAAGLMVACSVLVAVSAWLFKLASADVDLRRPSTLLDRRIALGMAAYALSFGLNVAAYRDGSLSALYPLLELSVLWAFLISTLVLGERATRRHVVGVLLMFAGCLLMVGPS